MPTAGIAWVAPSNIQAPVVASGKGAFVAFVNDGPYRHIVDAAGLRWDYWPGILLGRFVMSVALNMIIDGLVTLKDR
jgi:hypothetical protein